MKCCPTCGQQMPEPFDAIVAKLPKPLPPTQRAVFQALYEAGPNGLSREHLYNKVWGTLVNPPNEKVMDVTVSYLRKKLAGHYAIYSKYAVRRQFDSGLYRLEKINANVPRAARESAAAAPGTAE